MIPSPFEAARAIGTNIAGGVQRGRDESAIENILSQAMQSKDPQILQDSIGKILSQVSPERQGQAVKYLQDAYQNVQKKQQMTQEEMRGRQAAKEAGYTFGAPSAVQAQEVKERAKTKRLAQYGLDIPETPPETIDVNEPMGNKPALGSVFKKLSDDQLVVASGAEDKQISEPAKSELKSRQEERKIQQKQQSDVFKTNLERSDKVIQRAEKIGQELPQKRTALNLMKDAVSQRNLSFFSGDNLAEITGIEDLRSQEGSIFKTAGKEYFLGSIARAGARPNQWIEKQIQDMMAKIGRVPEANFSVLRALENELDLDQETERITYELEDKLEKEGDYSKAKLGRMVNNHMQKYAEQKQDILFNDLRAIKAIAENKSQKFRKVTKGTQVSDYMAQALLQQYSNDPKKAAEEAKKLGYEF